MRLALLVVAAIVTAPQSVTRTIEIWSVDPIAVDIEWITVYETGKAAVTLRRQTAVGPPAPLEFVHGDDRYVRFSYKGASPRTYSTSELIAAKKLHVPDVLPGGELFLVSPAMTVRPIAVEVTGPRVHVLPIERVGHVSLAGIPAGDYRIEPVYEGGLKGEAQTVSITATETTILFMPPENVGQVRITAPAEVCDTATEAGINAWQISRIGLEIKSPPQRGRVLSWAQPRCEVTVAGLHPGEFEAYFRRGTSNAGAHNFSIAAQTVTTAAVHTSLVRVEGRVTFNGRPVEGASVRFAMQTRGLTHGPPANAEARTDASGYYLITLDTPGTYTATTTRARGGMRQTTAVLVAGRNLHDIATTGGTMRFLFTGWDGKTPVIVWVRGEKTERMTTFRPNENVPRVLEELAFGEYRVFAGSGEPPTRGELPNAQTVILTGARPDVTLTFDVRKK
jgi:hypothetical protein